jgi:uncharacterized membrane protein YuzA (DUF378 family)
MRRDNPLFIAHVIALILAVVGAVNWGLVGAFDFNLVAAILGEDTMASNIVYMLVGLAGLLLAATSLGMLSTSGDYDRQRPAVGR